MAAPVGPKKVHRYTLEFKIQAVKLANHPEIQTQDVAHALDIHPFMLSKWKKDYRDRKSTRLNSSHSQISYAVFCLKKKTGSPLCRFGSEEVAHVQQRAL